MRPKDVWEKPQNGGDGRRKRTTSGRKHRADSGSGTAANNSSDGTPLYSNPSSPANEGGQVDGTDTEPQLPVLKHRRSSSDQLLSPQNKRRTLNDVSAMAALQRAIKSSPHKFRGTEHVSIEVGDLTPQPTRRILFPSPTGSQEVNSKRTFTTGIGRQEPSRKSSESDSKDTNSQTNKENCPPTEEEEHEQSFDGELFLNIRSTTPTPTRSKRAMVYKTPSRSPGRLPPMTGDFFSSAAKALLQAPTTPKRTPTKDAQPLGELTPFTAHLNQLLSETNNASPGSHGFDFPSLPSLRNTPGRASRNLEFDLTQFDSQDLVSTDVPMPSSPPAWFGVYEDAVDRTGDSLWDGYQLPHSPSNLDDERIMAADGKDSRASDFGLDAD